MGIATLAFMMFSSLASPASEIPKIPSAPPPLAKKAPPERFHCRRFFIYQGKKLPCDSNLNEDGEGLRFLLADTPQGISELNAYQIGQKQVQDLSYVSTAGAFLVLGSLTFGRKIQGMTGVPIRNVSLVTGLWLIGISFLSAIDFLNSNEVHLENAIHHYNQLHPETPIELHLSKSFF